MSHLELLNVLVGECHNAPMPQNKILQIFKYIAFGIGGMILVSTVIGLALFQRYERPTITETAAYATCEKDPTSRCMANIAMAALPTSSRFTSVNKDRAKDYLNVVGADSVESRVSADGRQINLTILNRHANSHRLLSAARRDPASVDTIASDYSASAHHISVLQSMQDHHRHGGGWGNIASAEISAFERRLPLIFTPAVAAIIKSWKRAINRLPTNRRQQHWTALAVNLVKFGEKRQALEAAVKATEYSASYRLFDLIGLLVDLGETDLATELVDDIHSHGPATKKFGKHASKVLADRAIKRAKNGKFDAARILIKFGYDLLQVARRTTDQVKGLGRLIEASVATDQIEQAEILARRLYQLARTEDPFRPFNLLIAAKGFYDVGDKTGAYDVIFAALKSLPPENKAVAVGMHLGPIKYDDSKFGLKSGFLKKTATILIRLGQIDQAIQVAKDAVLNNRYAVGTEIFDFSCKIPE